MVKKFFLCFAFVLLLRQFSPAEEAYVLDKITVKKSFSDISQEKRLCNSSSIETLTALEIKEKGLNSLSDILNHVSGMDLRSRGAFGIQSDISLRGSTYEQVSVLIDGIKVLDPQTGHFNLDIPLTTFDLDRVEIVKQGASSLYGAGSFAGSINIITKKPVKRSLNVETAFGEHALFSEKFSYSLPGENFSHRVSLDHKISSGGRPNTDFEYSTASFYLNKDFGENSLDALFGYQEKDFGADSFYSNLFSEEEEHTRTLFIRTGLDGKMDNFGLKSNLFFRRHRDKFILRRNTPTSVNYHTTNVYGFDSQLELPLSWGSLYLGGNTGMDKIRSSNLNSHSRLYQGMNLGVSREIINRLNTDLNFRLDHYQTWDLQESFNFGLKYALIEDTLSVRGGISRAFRIPTFTELYYSDAANQGNSELGVEKSYNFLLGADLKNEFFDFCLEGFLRRGYDLIDWTRTSTALPWSATNLGQVDFRGISFNSAFKAGLRYKGVELSRVRFSYDYLSTGKKTSGFFSKYALDVLKHQYILCINSVLLGIDIDWQLSYSERYYGETYFVGDLYIGKKLENRKFSLEPFIKIDNFSNAKYTEVSGVVQPGRWVQTGVKFEW